MLRGVLLTTRPRFNITCFGHNPSCFNAREWNESLNRCFITYVRIRPYRTGWEFKRDLPPWVRHRLRLPQEFSKNEKIYHESTPRWGVFIERRRNKLRFLSFFFSLITARLKLVKIICGVRVSIFRQSLLWWVSSVRPISLIETVAFKKRISTYNLRLEFLKTNFQNTLSNCDLFLNLYVFLWLLIYRWKLLRV